MSEAGLDDTVLTDGVIGLRRPRDGDVDTIAALVRGSIDHLTPWMVWASPDYDAESVRAWMTRTFDPTSEPFVIENPAGNIVGSCGLNDIREANGVANLGYWLGKDHTGNGYATRATDLLLHWALGARGLTRIEVIMSVENEPSRVVAERSQAHYEGVRRGYLRYEGRNHDSHCFALLADDLAGTEYI